MTDKKERILSTALDLFSNQGYDTVSTSALARKAGVSEGLIFRHFENKKGLLHAIIEDAELKINRIFAPIFFEEDPKKLIRRVVELPFSVSEDEYAYWKLVYKLKWEEEYYNPNKMKPVLEKLSKTFEELGYEDPEQEAEMLNHLLDAISTGILRDGLERHLPMKSFLLKKYGV